MLRPVPPSSSRGNTPNSPQRAGASDPLLQFNPEAPAARADDGFVRASVSTGHDVAPASSHRVAPRVRRPVTEVPASRAAAITRRPITARRARRAWLSPQSLWWLASGAAVGTALAVFAVMASPSAAAPELPGSPLTIPIEPVPVPSAVKARHLAFAPFAAVEPTKDTAAVFQTAVNRPRADAQFYGSLVIDSMPNNARAFVNGRPVGNTPLVLTGVPVGSRAIRIEADDHAPWSSTVRVVAGQRMRIHVTLAPSK